MKVKLPLRHGLCKVLTKGVDVQKQWTLGQYRYSSQSDLSVDPSQWHMTCDFLPFFPVISPPSILSSQSRRTWFYELSFIYHTYTYISYIYNWMLYIDKSFYNSTENYLALALIQTGSVWIFLPQRFVFVWFCICNCVYMYIYVIVFVFSNGVETGCVVVLFLCPSEFSGLSQLQGRR